MVKKFHRQHYLDECYIILINQKHSKPIVKHFGFFQQISNDVIFFGLSIFTRKFLSI